MPNTGKDEMDTLYKPGQKAPLSGEYELVTETGEKTDYDFVTLDEGETFPDVKESNLCYKSHTTDEDMSEDELDKDEMNMSEDGNI